MSLPRPRLLSAALAAVLLLGPGLSACGSSNAADSGGGKSDSKAAGQSGDAFPRTVKTLHGKVTIEKKPKRIVALGVTAADELDSLGITPAAIGTDAKTLKEQQSWMNQKLASKAHGDIFVNAEVQPEAVADLKPDLIIGSPYQLQDKSVYDQLNQIAPTVVPKTANNNPSWDVRLKYTAQAVDESDKADAIISDIKKKYADVGKQVPNIDQKTYNLANFGKGTFGIGNGSLFELFGMKPTKLQAQANGTGKLGKTKSVSQEKMDQVDADILALWPISPNDKKSLQSDPRYKKLSAVQKGTVYNLSVKNTGAFQSASPSSLRWLLPKLTPLVKKLG